VVVAALRVLRLWESRHGSLQNIYGRLQQFAGVVGWVRRTLRFSGGGTPSAATG